MDSLCIFDCIYSLAVKIDSVWVDGHVVHGMDPSHGSYNSLVGSNSYCFILLIIMWNVEGPWVKPMMAIVTVG